MKNIILPFDSSVQSIALLLFILIFLTLSIRGNNSIKLDIERLRTMNKKKIAVRAIA